MTQKFSDTILAQSKALKRQGNLLIDSGVQPDSGLQYEDMRRIREEAWRTRFPGFPDPTGEGGRVLTFGQTEAGARLTASLGRETERVAGRERLKLEDTLDQLATELLPPGEVETAMRQVRRGELVKSKLAFQAVLENLADEARNTERRHDLDLQEENEKRTLREARSRITIDMMGRDVGRAILFALGGGGE